MDSRNIQDFALIRAVLFLFYRQIFWQKFYLKKNRNFSNPILATELVADETKYSDPKE